MSLLDLFHVLQVVFGIGLVIFVHEGGHYLAARWCGARVDVFSLGFGPKLFGWRRGDTLFQVAVVPLGGYVKVAGEFNERGGEPEPGTLATLSVPQRFLYYSGGVIMNVVFALVVMPLVMFAGLPASQPIIGTPEAGGPAWEAGVPPGSRVLTIDGVEIVDFDHVRMAIVLNGKEASTLVVQPPDALEPATFVIEPRFDEEFGIYRMGLPLGRDPDQAIIVGPDTPASRAGLVNGDRLIAVEGQPSMLPITAQLQRAFEARTTVRLVVVSGAEERRTVVVEPEDVTLKSRLIGVGPTTTHVAAVRTTGPAAELVVALGIEAEDDIVAIGGTPVWDSSSVRDALLSVDSGGTLSLTVRRAGHELELEAVLPAGIPAVWLRGDLALQQSATSARVTVLAGSPAEAAGLRDGDQIVSVNGTSIDDWDSVLKAIRREVALDHPVELEIWRDGSNPSRKDELTVVVSAEFSTAPSYGFAIAAATMVLREDTLSGALSAGFGATKRSFMEVWLSLKKMVFSDEISAKNMGGIISISVISFDTAGRGWASLFAFLAILSINLAIINLIPIPILDGGHLMFLLIEGVKGSPVSERAFGYSQVVGLVMIMSLMVFVTYQDIVRWFID